MRHNRRLLIAPLLALVVVLLVAGCPPTPGDAASTMIALKDVRFWAYQIQGIENDGAIDALVNSAYDLLVLEPTNTDRDNPTFDAKSMVSRLHASSASVAGKTKLVVAYIDIGEAEDWRYYWQNDWVAPTESQLGTPDFMVRPDPDGWAGNYPVAFWDTRWKDILINNTNSMLQKALDDGFDGIYMDWVEAYSDTAVMAAAQAAGVDPIEEMVKFIREIRTYARNQNPNFLIIPQNASELAELDSGYLAIVDAIGQEQIYFDGDADTIWADTNSGDVRMPATGDGYSTAFYERTLQPFLDAGKVVITVDYAQQAANVAEAHQNAAARGYIPYVALRSLSRLTQTPPPGYPG
ncbi:MAG: endo alpha-1,4 polygalactosaminidase [Planctomycetes bacterium]|nr:endo alpha-1,4 polygalactosaminidase [Planctomycetota bacterium]